MCKIQHTWPGGLSSIDGLKVDTDLTIVTFRMEGNMCLALGENRDVPVR